MAKSYTSTIEVSCRKEHTCVRCGGTYSYPFARTVKGQAGNPESATAKAQAAAATAVAKEVDVHPCPTCGTIQPDMIGQERAGSLHLVFWITLALIGLFVILRATDVLQSYTAAWIIAAICALATALYWTITSKDHNKDLNENKRIAAERVQTKGVQYQAGRTTPAPLGIGERTSSMGNLVAVGLVLAAAALIASPELLRMMRGWPINAACYTPVVGPDDVTRIYMPSQITSVKGYWAGRPNVSLRGQGPGGAPLSAVATTKDNRWGQSISAKSSEKKSNSTPYVDVRIPGVEGLAGKTVDCDIDLAIDYPEMVGSSSFETHHSNMHHSLKVTLAPAGAGETYRSWGWWSIAGGSVLMIVGGFMLIRMARGLQQQAIPTRTYPLNPPLAGPAVAMAPAYAPTGGFPVVPSTGPGQAPPPPPARPMSMPPPPMGAPPAIPVQPGSAPPPIGPPPAPPSPPDQIGLG